MRSLLPGGNPTQSRAGIPSARAVPIRLGGVLHDLGKVGVPDAIPRKTDRLTKEEYAVIKTHPSMGARMLAGRQLAAHDGLRWVLSRNGLGVTVRWPRRCA